MDEGNQVLPPGDSAALVVIEFPSFRDFIDAYSPIISEEGIFIRNADVSESNAFSVGDRVDFEVRLKDDFRLIQGAGVVVWLGPARAAAGATGTAIRFHDVDEPSQRLISRLVGNYVRDGGELFEIGGPIAGVEQVSEVEPGFEPTQLLDELSVDPQLTAETLKASEAVALFSGDGEEESAPQLEFESVSPGEVEQSDFATDTLLSATDEAADASGVSVADSIGLETIAIQVPPGLVATLAPEAAKAEDPSVEARAGGAKSDEDRPGETESVSEDLEGAHQGERSEHEARATGPLQEQIGLPPIADRVPGTEAALEAAEDGAAADLLGQIDVPLGDEFDEAFLGATMAPMEADLGGHRGIPGEIAQVAGELTVIRRYDLPEAEEASSVSYAGSASARPERNIGGRIAALAVAAVLLGAGAFYFGDTMIGFLGIGDEDDAALTEMVRAEEAMPTTSIPTADDSSEVTSSTAYEGGDGAESDSGAEAQSDGTSGEAPAGDSIAAAGERAVSGLGPPSDSNAAIPVVTAASGPRPAAAALPPAAPNDVRRVERITWREQGKSTVVTIRLNTELSKAYLEVVRVSGGAPREVIKIQGIEAPYSPSEVAIGSSHVLRLRIGLHRANGGSVLHVVADLTNAGVSILSIQPKGRDLEITFS